jgi:hypothetical protein
VDAAIGDLGNVWVRDITMVAESIAAWCPVVWVDDVELLKKTDSAQARRTALLRNPDYPKLGDAITILQQLTARARSLNLPGLGPIVGAECLKFWEDTMAHGIKTVVVTYALYMLFEKLPKITDTELKKAEVEAWVEKFRAAKREVPQVYIDALRAAC